MEDSKLSILRFVFGPRLAVLLLTKVELVEVPAGTVAATAGVPGHWRTYVLYGTVATTSPNRSYSEGGVVVGGQAGQIFRQCRCAQCDLLARVASA